MKLAQENSNTENPIHIDVNLIPKHTQEVLAAATLELFHDIIAQDGGREALDNKIAELGL